MVLGLLLAPAPSLAHGGASAVVPTIESIEPALPPGVHVTSRATEVAPLMQIELTSDETVEVLQANGAPWLRITTGGVEVDRSQTDTYTTASPVGGGVPQEVLRGEVDIEWVRVSDQPEWAWFEHRLHPEGLPSPRAPVAGMTEPLVLAAWDVDMRTSGATHRVSGTLQLQPVTGTIRAELTSTSPAGVAVTLLPGPIPGVLLGLEGAEHVEVFGATGEPFLRFAADGVEVNTQSLSFRDEQAARGLPLPESRDAALDEARWQPVSSVPRHAWLETRARPNLSLPDGIRFGGRVVDLVEWEIPLSVDGTSHVLAGVTRWEPLVIEDADGARVVPWLLGGAGVAVGVLALRRRRAS